jgi:uncharacterized Zn-finger protein
MSYFPSGGLPERRSLNSPNPACFEISSSQEEQQEWTTAYSAGVYGFAAQRPTPFKPDSSLGLGLFTLPVSTAQAYLELGQEPNYATSTAPVTWPSQLSIAHGPIVQPQPVKAHSRSVASCNPLSTLKPEALWSPPQLFAFEGPTYDVTPALSDHSPSPHPSVVSTPYARSDSVIFSADSPSVKVESDPQPLVPQIQCIPEPAVGEQPLVVNPEDLIVRRSTPIEERLKACLVSSSASEASDLTPSIARSTRRRAFSTEDLLEDRKKRAYTKPNQATCACEQCGKLFQRTYNLRAHMETHDPKRSQPHACWYDDCDKRFVRRTDLVRHEQSVSMRAIRSNDCANI